MQILKKNSLALFGGKPLRKKLFPGHYVIGKNEKKAICKFIDSKKELSGFLGGWNNKFYGGENVKEFEKKWSEYINCKYTITFNSNTSGLCAAIGAAGVGPGDEVIVTPYSMSATATSIISFQGLPVFCDIDPKTFCLDPEEVIKKITKRTKAIMTTAVFGHPSDMDKLIAIAKKYNLVVIEDAAQAPGAIYKNKMLGTKAHMSVFSLNVHKHIHTGEGGMVTTNYSKFSHKLQLIRNHAEAVVDGNNQKDIINCVGFNLRFTEIQAVIALEQLKKLPKLLDQRIKNANYLSKNLAQIPGIIPAHVQKNCKHVYYVQPFLIKKEILGLDRDKFIEAVSRELPTSEDRPEDHLISVGFTKPIYMLPMYQKKIAYGKRGWPFSYDKISMSINYSKGICPVTENIENNEIFINDFIRPPATLQDMKDVVDAFFKVYENLHQFK